LQRDQPIRIWGQARAKAQVVVSLNGLVEEVRATKEGKWEARFLAMPAGGPYQIEVTSKKESILLENVLIGDIWLCSGQSNMEWSVADAQNAEAEIAAASDNSIRHFGVPKSYATSPSDELAGGVWQLTNPENVGSFTAVGYFFARELRKHTNVPIGILHTSWGGSRIEPWMSRETLREAGQEDILEVAIEKAREEQAAEMATLRAKFPTLTTEDQGSSNGVYHWPAAVLSEQDWAEIQVPGLWETQDYAQFDGIAWYRTSFTLTEEEAQQAAVLHLGQIDDSDISWVNGQRVGGMQMAYNKLRIYELKGGILKAGENSIAVRVEDTGGGGGIYGESENIKLVMATKTISLSGEWKFRPGAYLDKGSVLSNANQLPTLLYNKMIHPLLRLPIKGALWYQGESNANTAEDAVAYRYYFQDMIRRWRAIWDIGDFPFLYVQLANYMPAEEQPTDSNWALLRESQSAALSLPNTAQAVIIDIGEADDIHPRNKQDVGLRLSLAARKIAYEEEITHSGPTLENYEINEGEFLLRFNTYGSHLACDNPYGYLRAFAIAGADQKFVWAKAILSGDEIRVWSEEVSKPLYLRFAWADNPADANLTNEEGLPASPFRIVPVQKND
jgi:sialate O-acetylesterase